MRLRFLSGYWCNVGEMDTKLGKQCGKTVSQTILKTSNKDVHWWSHCQTWFNVSVQWEQDRCDTAGCQSVLSDWTISVALANGSRDCPCGRLACSLDVIIKLPWPLSHSRSLSFTWSSYDVVVTSVSGSRVIAVIVSYSQIVGSSVSHQYSHQ